jgi:alpha-glucosidase
MLALPGSAYMYQGEELGLHEVGQIPADERQDPAFFRNAGVEVGRDGCRVPLPWEPVGASFGFGSSAAHLPQPVWFADRAVSVQAADPGSTLALYRRALSLRRELQTTEELVWHPAGSGVLHFERPGGWHCLTNFTPEPIPAPEGEILLSTQPLTAGLVPTDTTIWFRA